MTTIHMPARLLFAVGAASAIAITPAIVAFAVPAATRSVADSNVIQNCTASETKGSVDLNCSPQNGGASASNGLASESNLTQQNETRHH